MADSQHGDKSNYIRDPGDTFIPMDNAVSTESDHKRNDTKDDDTKSIIKLRRQASYRLSTNDAVQNKEAFQGENIQDSRYDSTEIPP